MGHMFLIVAVSILCGILYRMGGTSLGTKWRDFGVPLAVAFALPFHWAVIPSAVLFFFSLTTYWKRKGSDAKWINWYITSLFYCVAFAPYAIVQQKFEDFGWLIIVSPILCSTFSQMIDTDTIEEFGRGFISAFCILLFLH